MQTSELVKLYYRIGEVSEIVGVQPHVLRYWETEFRSIRPQKSSKGQRVYSRRDVEKLLRVKDLLRNQGFTIAGARKRLSDPADAAASLAPPAPAAVTPAVTSAVVSLMTVPSAGLSSAGTPPAAKAPTAAATPAPVSLAAVSMPRALVVAAPAPAVEEPLAARAVAQGLAERGVTRAVAERGAKDMRRALLGLRQDLVRMLGEIDATRARDRGEH
jgi:DNA-binding transcriptional MerR regulator